RAAWTSRSRRRATFPSTCSATRRASRRRTARRGRRATRSSRSASEPCSVAGHGRDVVDLERGPARWVGLLVEDDLFRLLVVGPAVEELDAVDRHLDAPRSGFPLGGIE